MEKPGYINSLPCLVKVALIGGCLATVYDSDKSEVLPARKHHALHLNVDTK